MDDDAISERNALKSLVEKAEFLTDNFSYLSSIVKWIDGSPCLMNLQIVNGLTTKKLYALLNGLLEIEQALFVSLFINSSAIRTVGLPFLSFLFTVMLSNTHKD